jgi:hypothetical protein
MKIPRTRHPAVHIVSILLGASPDYNEKRTKYVRFKWFRGLTITPKNADYIRSFLNRWDYAELEYGVSGCYYRHAYISLKIPNKEFENFAPFTENQLFLFAKMPKMKL